MQIIPSMLVTTKEEFLEQITAANEHLKMIQFDIADGKFVPNTTWSDPEVVAQNTNINIEIHLMVENPLEVAEKWKDIKQVKRILFHFESTNNTEEVINTLKQYGWDISIVLNPDTDPSVVEPYINEIQGVMFMSVYPGFQGQKFIPETLDKVKKIKAEHPELFVELDGGVNKETITDIAKSGADAVCPGSAVFGDVSKVKENVEKLKEIIQTHTTYPVSN